MTHTPNPGLFKDRILAYLRVCTDSNHPKVSRQLQAQWNLSDLAIRQTVGLLRDDGEPIASGPKGFFFATAPDELEATIVDLKKRIAVISRRRYMLISAQNKMKETVGGQRLLFTNIEK